MSKAKAALMLSDEDLHERYGKRGFLDAAALREVAAHNILGSWEALLTHKRKQVDEAELHRDDYEDECAMVENLRALEKKLRHALLYDFDVGALYSTHENQEPPCECGIITDSDQKYLESKRQATTSQSADEEGDSDEVEGDFPEGEDPRGRRLTEGTRTAVREAFEQGTTTREVARMFGVSKGTASYWKKKIFG